MVGKGIRGVMCLIIRHYTKANNKRIKDYDKNKESSYLEYCDVNNLYKVGQYIVINNCRCRCYEIKDLLYDKSHVYFY